MRKNIKVLDVTLRDGGCVIDFNFGAHYMNKILSSLEESGVDYIELGYIDSNKGSESGRTQFINEKVIYDFFLKEKKPGCNYVAMIDHGKYDTDLLETHNSNSIDGIRYCFHKEDLYDAINKCRSIIEKGYKLFIQPMVTMRYSDEEFCQLVELICEELPLCSGLYIVDSFGEMCFDDLLHLFSVANSKLPKKLSIGFHSHNNLQLSYSNVIQLLKIDTDREIMIDSSVMGMGKGAGNLNTELLLEHLNKYYQFNYHIESLLRVIDEVINPIHSEHYWGYSVEYFLSSKYHCTPSYASHFYNKHMLSIENVSKLLSLIDSNKRNSFDKNYAEKLYEQFNKEKSNMNDTATTERVKKMLNGKEALIIAPGKSISIYKSIINRIISKRNIISFSLNMYDVFPTNFYIITRPRLSLPNKSNDRIIFSSNVCEQYPFASSVLNYDKWILTDKNGVHDSSSVICINFLLSMGVKKIYLAGFDGFSVVNSKNYYNDELRNSLDATQVDLRNLFYSKFFEKVRKSVDLEFVTPSIYEN